MLKMAFISAGFWTSPLMAVDSFTYAGDADGMMEMLCKVVNFASV